jgi:DNA-directed RNA polymerase subunit delta
MSEQIGEPLDDDGLDEDLDKGESLDEGDDVLDDEEDDLLDEEDDIEFDDDDEDDEEDIPL